jgi:hypothetical protein
MREIRTSSSMRGGRKRAFARRACLLLYRVPIVKKAFFLTKLVRSWFASFEVRT